jgi:hypothetical protein
MTKASVAQNPARNAPRKIRVGSGGHKANAVLFGQTGTVRAFRVLPSRVKVVPIRSTARTCKRPPATDATHDH